ncbi:MAG TPA: lysophospholipid acyltransferase family protein [Actinomycetota bacterium]|nr:lysophospholipid acyltransferase family protein [Actinomycetota bacterium]
MAAGELNRWWRIGLVVVAPLVRLLFRPRITGVEHVPATGPAILVFNHVSTFDGPVLAIETSRRTRRETRFVVASEFFAKPFFGWILRRFDQIKIRRGEGDADALEHAFAALKDGRLLAIAPEGTVNPDPPELLRIRSGIARIALPTGAPVVPVGIWGTNRRWPRSGLTWSRPLRPRLAIVYGAPVLPVGGEGGDDLDAFVARIRDLLDAQVAEAMRLAGQPA